MVLIMYTFTTKQQIIDRLQKSYTLHTALLKTKATKNGRYWAQHIAQATHLQRLSNWYNNELFRGEPLAPYSWLDTVSLAISDDNEDPDPDACEFFRIPKQYINDLVYIEDFVLGAIDFWDSVEEQVIQTS